MKKTYVTLLFVVALFVAAPRAEAYSIAELQAQVQTLMRILEELQVLIAEKLKLQTPVVVPPVVVEPPVIVGNDRDEHGCIGSAGYLWCESLDSCVRPWETECPAVHDDPITLPPVSEEDPSLDQRCKSWYDGCNNCSRQTPDGNAMCTLRYCFQHEKPYCTGYFEKEPVDPGLGTVACPALWAPVCGQPAFSCPKGMFCAQVMPMPRTYSNTCMMRSAGASFLYEGECR